ncbi:1-deoxy-D-xylulose-5-phosphate synthase N-terminal domain-containing protein [Shigella flexneri]
MALHYVYNTPFDQLIWDVGRGLSAQNSDRPSRQN